MTQILLFALCCVLALASATAAPYRPSSDQQVLERLPSRSADPRARALAELRRRQAQAPRDIDLAVALVRAYVDEVAAEGDPRYIGYAQAALGPWWDLPDPPAQVRVMRAVLRQFNHEFDAALADLAAVVKGDPTHAEALAWQAAIAMVQARYADARAACEGMAPQVSKLIAAACVAYVDSVTGQSAAASAALGSALSTAAALSDALAQGRESGASSAADGLAAERLWAMTRLAEIEERRGEWAAAEVQYRQALALGVPDGYLLAAYADFLLDRGRPNEVLALLKGRQRSDLLLLRLALAAKASEAGAGAAKAATAPGLADWTRELTARFDAARLRGDAVHHKEESRFALGILEQAERALTLAQSNYAVQREPADARVLLEAALAARMPKAAEPVLQWMARSGIESVALRSLARQIEALR